MNERATGVSRPTKTAQSSQRSNQRSARSSRAGPRWNQRPAALEERPAAVEPDPPADQRADEVADRARERDGEVGVEPAALGAEDDELAAERPRGERARVDHDQLAGCGEDGVDRHQDEDGPEAVRGEERRHRSWTLDERSPRRRRSCPQAIARLRGAAAASTSAETSSTASARAMRAPAASERQVRKSTAWRSRGDEHLPSSTTGAPAGGEDLGRFVQVGVQRLQGHADGVDELGVAQDVAVHRLGALVVGVELVERPGEPLPRVGDRAPGLEVGPRVRRPVVGRARREQLGVVGKWRYTVWRWTPARRATSLSVVRAGPTVPCSSTAASVIRRRVSAISSARFFSSYLRFGVHFVIHRCASNIDRSGGLA